MKSRALLTDIIVETRESFKAWLETDEAKEAIEETLRQGLDQESYVNQVRRSQRLPRKANI